MHAIKGIKIFLFVAVLMLAAKPFIGFRILPHFQGSRPTILVKAFTKRKQEYTEKSESDITFIQKRLADPVTASLLLFSFLLSILFPAVIGLGKTATNQILASFNLGLVAPQPAYLMAGQLII